jgi:branched-chain amino acid transport system permease protein
VALARRYWTLAVLAALAAFPVVVTDGYLLHLAVLGLILAVVASNWDLTLGYARLFNFAHVAFFALGAYASGVLVVHAGIPPVVGIVAGAVVAVIASVFAYIPVYRVRGIYVALISFAFSQLCLHLVVSQSDLTGGFNGLVGLPELVIGPIDFATSRIAYFYAALALLIASTAFLRRLVKSDFGLSLIAAGTYEAYALSRGVPVARQRLLGFMASAVFSGAAGALYAHYLGVVSPELFSFSFSAFVLTMVLVGGIATTYGPIVAAVALTFASELLGELGPWRFVLVAVLMIVTMLFAPGGLWRLTSRLSGRRTRPAVGESRAEPPVLEDRVSG